MRITWFGHSTFRLEIADKIVLIDPFFTHNPSFTLDMQEATRGTTHILITHGHTDHTGDAVEIAQQTGATLVSSFEICEFLGAKGVAKTDPMNTGGTTDQGGFLVTLVQAFHSSGQFDNGAWHQLGHPNGIIVEAENEPTLYHMGDTAIFGDMALINELYEPRIGIVPIGGRFTMGPRIAAHACNEFFDFDMIIPCHYGSFPPLEKTADRFLDYMDHSKATTVKVPEIGVPFEA